MILTILLLPLFGQTMAGQNLRSQTILSEDGPWNKRTWNPSEQELTNTLDISLTYLKDNQSKIYEKISNYHVQAIGYEDPTKKMIHLNFYCDEEKKERYIFAFDGGDCYFRLNVDLLEKKVIDFDVNGEA